MRLRILALPVVLLALAGGIWLGSHPAWLPGFVRTVLVGVDATRVVDEAIAEVNESYYREIPKRDLANAAIAGMVESLGDRFSAYFTPREYARYQQVQNSEFSGIGTTVAEDPLGLRIVTVYDKSPAEREGIKPGDRIVAANGRSLKGRSSEEATSLVKGPAGTSVRLTVRRAGKDRVVTVRRATVSVPQVASEMTTYEDTRYGVIKLAQFGSGAHSEVYAAIRQVRDRGAKGIVFDLRGNGGGLVSEAQLIASAFIAEGPIVTTRGRGVPDRTLRATGDPVAKDVPLVVLVDGDTASASEIVAGALQDTKRAEVVGTKTFGKGVFQEVIELSNGGALDITAGQYFTPEGRNLGGKGVSTGAGIKADVAATDDPKTQRDEALPVALEALASEAA
jgi:carboxyl-terminal processing protease